MADRIRTFVGPTATLTDIAHTRDVVGSSLTAVDLTGLTRVELGFALLLAAAAGGLVLFLGLTERRRSFAVATALGATAHQLRRLVTAEPWYWPSAASPPVRGSVGHCPRSWSPS